MNFINRVWICFSVLIFFAGNFYATDIKEVRSIYIQGAQALANNDLSTAERSFKTIIAMTGTSSSRTELNRYKARSHYFLGDVYFIRRDYVSAIQNYRAVVQHYPTSEIHSRTLYKLGRTLILDNKFHQAIAVLNEYLAKYDNKDNLADNAHYWVGRAYVGVKDYPRALSTFQEILSKYPDSALAYDVRGFITKINGLIEEERQAQMSAPQTLSNRLQELQQRSLKLEQEKDVLEKISGLLTIKQRLLEIKAEKVDLLYELRAQRRRE
jgi:outer membrane protein assembly factor BamD (BamD/ComL family)